MNDRTRWDEPRQERGGDDYRQGSQQSQQDWGRGSGRQQGGWNDDDDGRRQGSYRGNEWRGERDWGSPSYGYSGTQGQPQQREWRSSSQDRNMGAGSSRFGSGEYDQGDYGYAARAWGGSSDRYGSRPTSSGSMHRDEMGETTRMRQDREMRERRDLTAHDVGARRGQDWYQHDDGRAGSQSFASGYGMSDGPNYDQWGGPEQRRNYGHSGGSNPTFGRGYGPDYMNQDNRGFFARAGDEIASWFGDEDAARRREQDYRGHGPSDYTRSDERIREDVNDKLTDDPRVDARRISVAVDKGEVTLSGTVGSREAKRRAEDCIDRISGVKHVQNNLRVEERSLSGSSGSSWGGGSSTGYHATRETGGVPAGGMGATGSTSGASGSSSSTGLTGTTGSSGTTGTSGTSGSSASGSTTPTTGGTSSQGASTGTMGSSGRSSRTSGSSSASKSG